TPLVDIQPAAARMHNVHPSSLLQSHGVTERVGCPPVERFLYVLPAAAAATLGDASWVPGSTCETGSRHQAQTDLWRLTPSTPQRSAPPTPDFHSPVVPAGHENLRRIRNPSARPDKLRILRLRSQARFAQDDMSLGG